MEKLTPKHNHTLTDILKVCIFAIFLMMPFFTMLPTMLYYGFNEHAKGIDIVTEGGWEVNELFNTNEVNNVNDIIANNIYHFDTLEIDGQDLYESQTQDLDFYIEFCEDYSIEYSDVEINDYDFLFNLNTNSASVYIALNSNVITYGINVGDSFIQTNLTEFNNIVFTNVDFRPISNTLNKFKTLCTYKNILPSISEFQKYEIHYTEEVEVQKNITQLIEKNWNDLWETNLYKWTNESILKEGLDNFTEVFGITDTSHITNLITYELIIVSVYIVIDIVLKMFTWLTHMIGNK